MTRAPQETFQAHVEVVDSEGLRRSLRTSSR